MSSFLVKLFEYMKQNTGDTAHEVGHSGYLPLRRLLFIVRQEHVGLAEIDERGYNCPH